jgi:hypothetical protein
MQEMSSCVIIRLENQPLNDQATNNKEDQQDLKIF